jgi:hypothetical protein
MSPLGRIGTAVVLVTFLPNVLTARASDLLEGMEVSMWVRPATPSSRRDRNREYLQKLPDFSLQDASKLLPPGRAGLIYRRERSEGNRLLLFAGSADLKGWAAASSVVPIDQADAFFSQAIRDHPNDAFAHLMRAIVRCQNDTSHTHSPM